MEITDDHLLALVRENPGQGTFEEYRYLRDLIAARRPASLLIFGVGRDSRLWFECNAGGLTTFIEHEPIWIEQTRMQLPEASIYQVRYETKCSQWRRLLERRDVLFMDDLPDDALSMHWDIIYVDSPQGWGPKTPGRMKSIYTASVLAQRCLGTDVLVHDCDRDVERTYADRYLGRDHFVRETGRTRHYRLRPLGGEIADIPFSSLGIPSSTKKPG